jgi:2'-hydroxyisoflavone reductase
MKILILGGTIFVGRAVTDAALAAGHQVTHMNRGKSAAPDPRVETLIGDRATTPFGVSEVNPTGIAGRRWDAVIDSSGYLPQVVGRSAEALRPAADRYLFVSTISAYAGEGYAEDSPLAPALDPVPEERTPPTYGPLKAMCEAVVRKTWGNDAIIVRPGLIVGPHDPTDRFTYWPARVSRGGIVAAPGRPQRTLQFIDARDLGRWMIALLERDGRGIFNATGPLQPVSMERVLEICREVSASDARFAWIDEDRLAAKGVAPWSEMPLWIPESDPHAHGFMDIPIRRALDMGLVFRPLAETIADTLAWSRTRPADHAWKAGLTAERERELLS